MGSIGHLIRQERLRQNMKQSALAEGICSTSHLSKIENNSATPSEEVIHLLMEKLKIPTHEFGHEEEERVIERLESIYKDAVIKRDHEQVRAFLNEFSEQKFHFNKLENFYTYNLVMCRLFLVLREQDVTPFLETLKSVKEHFNDRQLFMFNLNLGIYYYSIFEFQRSLEVLEGSFELLNAPTISGWERADYYNFIGTTYAKIEDYFRTIQYVSKALKYFRDQLHLHRAIDCYLNLAVAYKNTNQLSKAKESYLLGQKLARDLKLYSYEDIFYHNLGRIYSMDGDSEKAIENYHLSLQSKHQMTIKEGKIVTILALIIEYSKMNNSIQVIRWSEKGLDILNREYQDDDTALSTSYRHHYLIYAALHSNSPEKEAILKDAIEHFERINDYRYIHKYSVLLIDHYVTVEEFKKALDYFQKAEKAIFQQKKIRYWEDL